MWKNSLKNVGSDNNKILYETLLDFLQRNGTYFLNEPRISILSSSLIQIYIEEISPLQYKVQGGYIKLCDTTHLSDPCI